ncbi:unnamed protein product, partial [Nesidiocoris tenuis]
MFFHSKCRVFHCATRGDGRRQPETSDNRILPGRWLEPLVGGSSMAITLRLVECRTAKTVYNEPAWRAECCTTGGSMDVAVGGCTTSCSSDTRRPLGRTGHNTIEYNEIYSRYNHLCHLHEQLSSGNRKNGSTWTAHCGAAPLRGTEPPWRVRRPRTSGPQPIRDRQGRAQRRFKPPAVEDSIVESFGSAALSRRRALRDEQDEKKWHSKTTDPTNKSHGINFVGYLLIYKFARNSKSRKTQWDRDTVCNVLQLKTAVMARYTHFREKCQESIFPKNTCDIRYNW